MSFNFSDRVNNATKRILMIVKHNDESHALSFFSMKIQMHQPNQATHLNEVAPNELGER